MYVVEHNLRIVLFVRIIQFIIFRIIKSVLIFHSVYRSTIRNSIFLPILRVLLYNTNIQSHLFFSIIQSIKLIHLTNIVLIPTHTDIYTKCSINITNSPFEIVSNPLKEYTTNQFTLLNT